MASVIKELPIYCAFHITLNLNSQCESDCWVGQHRLRASTHCDKVAEISLLSGPGGQRNRKESRNRHQCLVCGQEDIVSQRGK